MGSVVVVWLVVEMLFGCQENRHYDDVVVAFGGWNFVWMLRKALWDLNYFLWFFNF